MLKLMALVCAATVTFSASAFGMHMAGWFSGAGEAAATTQAQQVSSADPLQSEAGIRFRQNQNLNWRCVMMLRE